MELKKELLRNASGIPISPIAGVGTVYMEDGVTSLSRFLSDMQVGGSPQGIITVTTAEQLQELLQSGGDNLYIKLLGDIRFADGYSGDRTLYIINDNITIDGYNAQLHEPLEIQGTFFTTLLGINTNKNINASTKEQIDDYFYGYSVYLKVLNCIVSGGDMNLFGLIGSIVIGNMVIHAKDESGNIIWSDESGKITLEASNGSAVVIGNVVSESIDQTSYANYIVENNLTYVS